MRQEQDQDQHSRLLRRAIELAMGNVKTGAGGPFGAVIVRKGKTLAECANRVTAKSDPTAHAEIEAIRAACGVLGTHQLNGCVLYTSCEPCPMCLSAIYWAGLDEIYYAATAADAEAAGFSDAFLYRELRCQPEERQKPIHCGLREEAQQVFAAWRQSAIKMPYDPRT